jgi:hypothetical protein
MVDVAQLAGNLRVGTEAVSNSSGRHVDPTAAGFMCSARIRPKLGRARRKYITMSQ